MGECGSYFGFDFQRIREHYWEMDCHEEAPPGHNLPLGRDHQSLLNYLQSAVLEATIAGGHEEFIGLCNLEIDRLRPGAQLQVHWKAAQMNKPSPFAFNSSRQSGTQGPEKIKSKTGHVRDQHPDLTADRAIFLFQRLVPNFENMDQTAVARVLAFFTSLNEANLRQRVNQCYKKEADQEGAFKDDMLIVRKYLADLGLEKELAQLDRDVSLTG